MRRLLVVLLTLVPLAACSSDRDDSASNSDAAVTSSTASMSGEQSWAEQAAVGVDVTRDEINGELVLVSEADRVVYVQDCDVARQITAAGGKYGPTPRNEDGSGGQNGYAYVCDD